MATSYSFRKRLKTFKRWRANHLPILLVGIGLSILGLIAYAGYMTDQRLSVNPESYKPLLGLIAQVESNGNYNAHYGNSRNTQVKFTEMSIAEVLQWQDNFVAQGNPSSAVGRYQIINGTLEGLVDQLQLNTEQKFDEPTQDAMAIALLERRGANEYVNQELTKEQFAANLAKEWAALPKVVGENPEQSYYAGDGLNASRVDPSTLLKAIEPIEPLNNL